MKNAFRLIPVRPAEYYIDTCLPFGLRFAPSVFNRLAAAIHWFLQNNYHVQFLLHYLDDFLTAGPPNSPVYNKNLESMSTLCQRINIPNKPEKITFLGIVIDTETMTASISNGTQGVKSTRAAALS